MEEVVLLALGWKLQIFTETSRNHTIVEPRKTAIELNN